MAQAAPSRVCLYRTFMSRSARKPSSSRNCHNSAISTGRHPERGSMWIVGTLDLHLWLKEVTLSDSIDQLTMSSE